MVCSRDGPGGHDGRQLRVALHHRLTNTPPTAANLARTVTAMLRPTSCSWQRCERRPLTFQTHTSPTHGLLRDLIRYRRVHLLARLRLPGLGPLHLQRQRRSGEQFCGHHELQHPRTAGHERERPA